MAVIAIIGSGVGGLATANLLAKQGHEVHVFEKNDQLGGRAGTFEQDGFTFDTGPSWYLMPSVFERYFQLLGTTTADQLELIRLEPAYKVYSGSNGHPITITGDLERDRVTFEAIEHGAGDALERYVQKSKDIYQLALQHFLYTNFDSVSSFTHRDILTRAYTMARLALTPLHRYVQRYVSHPQLQQILEYPMVFLGSSPYSAPAIYSMMSALDFDEGVYYPKGTMYSVITSLVNLGESNGVQYHLNAAVKKIIVTGHHASGIELVDGSTRDADVVISNADLHFTETELVDPAYQTYPEAYWRRKEASPSALLMYLGVSGEIPEFEHHTLLFTDDWKENFDAIFHTKHLPQPASLYISKTSHSDSTAPAGHENIFVLVPLPAGIDLSEQDCETAADAYLEQIKQTTGVDLKSRTVSRTLFGPRDFSQKYNAWQSSMLGPSHRLSQSAFFRTPNKSKKVDNLYYVGASTMPGIGVPMCLISAELVAKRVDARGETV